MANSLVSSIDLDDFPGGTDEGRFNQGFIDAAVARARARAGWHIAPVVTETVQLAARDGRTFDVPTLRLVSVSAIRWGGITYGPTDYTVRRNGIVTLNQRQRRTTTVAELDIVHGYDKCPPELLPVIAGMASSMASSRDPAATSVSVGQVRTEYAPLTRLQTESQFAAIDVYRLPSGVA